MKSAEGVGRRAPPDLVGELLKDLPEAVARSVLMAFEGRSITGRGKPVWLKAATDVRFVGIDGARDTVLRFEAPLLGDAAHELYRQSEIWPSRPPHDDTGFDLLADALSDVAASNTDSVRYDVPFLKHLVKFDRVLNGTYQEIDFTGNRFTKEEPAVLDTRVMANARTLSSETPDPQRVRVVGRLDMIEQSTHSFAINLRGGERVRGLFLVRNTSDLKMLFDKPVLVTGRAVYRPSGNVLRIDAEDVVSAEREAELWGSLPRPMKRIANRPQQKRHQTNKTGANAIFGKWPGEESEEELLDGLKQLG